MKKLCFLCLLLVFFGKTWALSSAETEFSENNTANLLSDEEKAIRQKIKLRSYPGGRDEEPLRVQSQLPAATRKMQPAQEPVEVADPSEEQTSPSND